ncbi:hypothetical protein DFH94DRAFT_809635 [Russula ochroleuca]|uniref:Uncharacterized protein n=1 Tax=Russula ochroleuca TaxID=152965 RepID=A0A9P5TDV9_9AGAM|nr:hypothetical protein DFH94DRAFT_809635 [Russula ochroleuca]
MADRITRASNANAHPGIVDRNPTRRTREEVLVKKEAKATAKARTAMERNAAIKRIAAFEKAKKRKAMDVDQDANDPGDLFVQARVRKTRKRPDTVDEDPANTPANKMKGDGARAAITAVEHNEEALLDADVMLTEGLNESGSTASMDEGENREMDEETQSERELEDEEPDTSIRVKKAEKKQKQGFLVREQISAAVAAIPDDPFGTAKTKGRVGLNVTSRVGTIQTPGPQSKRSLASRTPFGLKPNWQSTRSIQSPANVLQGSQGQAATLDPESDSDSNTPTPSRPSTFSHMHSRAAMTEPDDTPAYSYGGFMPESTELERFELEGGKNVSESLKYKSITKIQEIHAAPSPHITNWSMPMPKKRLVSYDHLPTAMKDRFKKKVIPLSLETTGALKPWAIPDDNAIVDIWNLIYDPDQQIEGGDLECQRFQVVKTLVKRAISAWLHRFAETAEKALVAEFTRRGLNTKGERAQLVRFLLGNIEDLSDKKRPFLWETVYDNPSARQEGIFQGRLVGRTFMEHLHIIDAIEPDERVKEPPVGALILAIQAVHRALLYSISGEFELPSDRKSSEFSKNNWGDYTLITPRGDRIVKRSSVFLKAIKNLKDQQWVDIFKVAMSFRATAKQPSKAEKDEEELLSETDSDEYDELGGRAPTIEFYERNLSMIAA